MKIYKQKYVSYDLSEQNSKGICTCNTSFLETCTHTIISSHVESTKQNYSIYLDTITSIKPMTYYPKMYLDGVVQTPKSSPRKMAVVSVSQILYCTGT